MKVSPLAGAGLRTTNLFWARALRWHGPDLVIAAILLCLLGAAGAASAQSVQGGDGGRMPPETAQGAAENGQAAAGPAHMAITYSSDLLFNTQGGAERGAMYDGRLGFIFDFDLAQAVGWSGASAHFSVHAIHGTGPAGDRVGNLLTVSGLEARPTVRLFNAWIEQQLGPSASLRVGQFTAAQEFMVSPTANLFVNSTFGWPSSFAVDLPSGGPAYPLAAPGLRLSLSPTKSTGLLVAVFAGDPAGPGGGDPQNRDRFGLNGFRFSGRAFLIAEGRWRLGASPSAPSLKLGAWKHFDRFDDLRVGGTGQGLTGLARTRRLAGDTAIYAILDGPLWTAGQRSLQGFVRGTLSPSDRNLIDRYLDLGLSLTGPLRQRPNDVLGLGIGVAHLSPAGRTAIGAVSSPGQEAVAELSYQIQLPRNISIQPDLQYVRRPNGGALDSVTLRPLKGAVVAGFRTSMRF